ncbi:hypothetical protein ES703_94164 [subsurface metagenome]
MHISVAGSEDYPPCGEDQFPDAEPVTPGEKAQYDYDKPANMRQYWPGKVEPKPLDAIAQEIHHPAANKADYQRSQEPPSQHLEKR